MPDVSRPVDAVSIDVRPSDDVSQPPDAWSACDAPRTSLETFDAFAEELVAAYVARLEWPGEAYARVAGLRTRVAVGRVVLDTTMWDACIAWIPTSEYFVPWTRPGSPCARIFVPRCPAPAGSPCYDTSECDRGLWCEVSGRGRACEAPGECTPVSPIGGPCEWDGEEQCAPPDPGFELTGCSGNWTTGFTCRNTSYRIDREHCTNQEEQTDGSIIHSTCGPGMICALESTAAGFTCYTPRPDQPEGSECYYGSECASGLVCIGRHCSRWRCSIVDGCPSNDGAACEDFYCARTTGMLGARCDVGYYDCLPGLACSEGRCAERVSIGEACGVDGDCLDGCCAVTDPWLLRECSPLSP